MCVQCCARPRRRERCEADDVNEILSTKLCYMLRAAKICLVRTFCGRRGSRPPHIYSTQHAIRLAHAHAQLRARNCSIQSAKGGVRNVGGVRHAKRSERYKGPQVARPTAAGWLARRTFVRHGITLRGNVWRGQDFNAFVHSRCSRVSRQNADSRETFAEWVVV